MKRFYLILFLVFIVFLRGFSQNVLIIWDDTTSSGYTSSLRSALRSAGMSVTYSAASEWNYTGSNPSPNGFCAVIHLNGGANAWVYDMPVAGQNALVNYVTNGGVYIHTEWDAYEYLYARMANMRNLILFDRSSGTIATMTYSVVTSMSSHPVLSGIPSSFVFYGAANMGPLHTFTTNPATLLMTDNYGSAAVAVRSFGNGKIIGFNHAGNYSSANVLANSNIQRLFINAITWGTAGATFPMFTAHPVSLTRCFGQSATFSATLSGATTLQWLKNGSPISGATTNTYSISSVSMSDTGTYKLVAISSCGRDTSHVAKLTIYSNINFTYSPYSRNKCTGDSVTFPPVVSASGTIHYQWRKNGSNLTNDTNRILRISNLGISNSGTYTCIASNSCWADTSDPAVLNVYAKPVAGFSINDSTQCLRGNRFVLTNSSSISSGNISSWLWKFGDNQTTISYAPSHVYDTAKTYKIRLIATSDHNCKDSVTKNVYIYPMPRLSFTINDSTQCLRSNSFVFTNNSTISGGTQTYTWNFGDGNTSSGTGSKTHTYLNYGTYQVKLSALSNNGCTDSITKNVFIYPMPHASFTVNDSTQCLRGNQFLFNNSSTISSGSINRFLWNFDDGRTDTTAGPVGHIYLLADTFHSRLVVTSDQGCRDTNYVNNYVFPKPSAAFTINDSTQCLTGNNFVFSNTSAISSGSLGYNWNFGDLSTASGNGTKNHSYTAFNTFPVKLLATSAFGCTDSIIKNVFVFSMPVASFSVDNPSQCFKGNNFTFTSASTIPAGFIQNYSWEFGDSKFSTLQGPVSHSYLSPDSFRTKLLVISNAGCRDSFYKSVYNRPMPVSNFMVNNNSQCLSGNNFLFRNTTTVAYGNISSDSWNLGDGNFSIKKDSVYHSYGSYDTFTIRLKVLSSYGCPDSIEKDVYVRPMPLSSFVMNNSNQCLSGNSFIFNNSSTIPYAMLSYQWNFGDGNTSALKNPLHSYTSDNKFQVKLLVTSSYNCKDSLVRTAWVYPMPKVRFSINDSTQCLSGNNFLFTNNSTINSGTLQTYQWSLGDNTFSASANTVSHNYLIDDTFAVKLLVTSDKGCKDSFRRTMIVHPMPDAGFNVNQQVQCFKGNLFGFINSSVIQHGSLTYLWKFGDMSSITSKNAVHIYSTNGNFMVNMVATSNKNCKDSAKITVTVNPTPVPAFKININEQCLSGNNFIFSNTGSISSGTMTHLWKFGDGNTSGNTNSSHIYLSDNIYDVTLISLSDLGCSDSISLPVTVHPMPHAAFKNSRSCLDQALVFTDQSSLNKPDIINKWEWDFGDGQFSSQQIATHIYSLPGNYHLLFKVSSNFGCEDTTSKDFYFFDHIPAAELVRATVINKNDILVEWVQPASVPPTAVIKSYTLERSADAVNYIKVGSFNVFTNRYLDKFMDVQNNSYIYRVTIVDTCDFKNEPSNIGKTILMKIDDSKEYPLLNWTKYLDWSGGVTEYQVQVYDVVSNDFKKMAVLTADTFYTDLEVRQNDSQNCYRIAAYRADGIFSLSNVRCLPTPFYLWTPNAFTPNQDLLNDTFSVAGKNILKYQISIYDRWGEEMFSSNDLNKSWDGNYKGNPCPVGVYYYFIIAKQTNAVIHQINGSVMLLR